MNFSNIAAVIMDMDGVLWRGDTPLPGMTEWFDLLRRRGLPFMLATNNGSNSPTTYVNKLAKLGINGITEEHIVTSGTTAGSYLKAHFSPDTPVHILGGDGLREIVTRAGFTLVNEGAAVVVAGLDPQLTYEKLKRAALLIRAGAVFIGTNDDSTFPTPEGLVPGAGSILAALQTATSKTPIIMGKPNPPMFEAALRSLGTTPAQTLMLGDRLNTDIEGAVGLGLHTALVLTGVSTREEVEASTVKPEAVYTGLPELIAAWEG
jgi:4-nitrophenyl phosphatase